jgi:hypothetical protein
MKPQKLSELMSTRKQALKIKDYAKVNEIFNLYCKDHYDKMAREIYFYKASEFIVDIVIYLQFHFMNLNGRMFFFEDIMDEYHIREAEIKEEMKLKAERKKYLL